MPETFRWIYVRIVGHVREGYLRRRVTVTSRPDRMWLK